MKAVKQPAAPVNSALRKRRHIGPETWSAVAAVISRERSLLAELAPNSVRIRPTLARITWLEREPGMAATEIQEAA